MDNPLTSIYSKDTTIYGKDTTQSPQYPQNIPSNGACEIMDMARAIAKQANAVAVDMDNRLSVVMHPAPPDVPANVEPVSSVAPLFADLRGQLFDIRNALYAISRMIGRLDL